MDGTPHQQMLQLITSYWVTQMIRGAAAISLADHLASGPKSADELADAGVLHPAVAFRFLRACVALGFVTHVGNGRFAATPLLDTLRKDAPGSLHGMALAQGAPGHWLSWGRFPDVLATGKHQAVEALGCEVFEHFASHPDEGADFSRAMSGLTTFMVADIVRVLDTRGVSRVVDVGGAEGALARGLLAANPELRGILFDLPGIVAGAKSVVEASGLGDRLELFGGDFFAAVPEGDLYVLKFILHDWDDEACLAILRNCRKAAPSGGRIAITELGLGEIGEGASLAPMMDMNMMALASGRERTFAQYATLLEAAGFTGAKATPITLGMLVIEATAP